MGRQLDKKILSEAGIEYVEDHMQNAIQGIKSKRAATLAEWLLDSEGILSQEACVSNSATLQCRSNLGGLG